VPASNTVDADAVGTMTTMGSHSGSSFDQTELRFLVEKNADGILVVDEDGIVLFANPAAEEIFGRPHQSLIGTSIGVPVTMGETAPIVIHKPDGQQLEAEVRVVETVWSHRPARLASLRDVSARKAAEERLSHVARMEAIGRLTAGIAHDFNNLLTVVLGNLESAQRKMVVDETGTRLALENAARGARRAAGLTQKLLAFARRKPLEPRVVDLNDLISGMTDLLRRTLGEAIRVRTVRAAELWPVHADPTELEAAILNLAVNARDAMPSGGELQVEMQNIALDSVQAVPLDVRPGNYVTIAVTDTGHGMSQDVLQHVFEPFFTTKGGRGTGLGLSQVYGFATQSGGAATLQSNPGRGTTATIYLPNADSTPAVPPDAASPAPVAPRGKRGETILVVEDDEDVRAFTAGTLKDLGYTVFEAGDAAAALQIVKREPAIGLLFTDLGLPGGVDGKALGESARRLRPELAVLITTAYAAGALIHDGRLDRGIDLLIKPFTFETLAARIREAMDRQRHRPEEPEEFRILVVEDEVLVRMYLVQTLQEMGFQVDEAGGAAEAIAKFAAVSDRLSLAVVDLGLPDRPGDAVAREMRRARPDLPIMLATGHADRAVRERVADLHVVEVLEKPFHRADIEAAFERLGIAVPRR
jgi:signal transduction histidine kinase/CheY-like chemotaxis protein